MEQERKSGFYVIEVLPLKKRSGKPFHVEERIRSRSRHRDGQLAGGASGVSGVPTNWAFLEARRNRLARRHSHVAEVMESNLNKKGDTHARNRIIETQERAERNRNSIIDMQVKTNASKVARAKQVAAQQQKKSNEKNEALRRNLEERLRASEARRRALQSIPRSRLLDASDLVALHKNVDEKESERIQDASATAIQTWWRLKCAEKVVETWNKCNVSLKRVKAIPFEKLIRLVQSKSVIKGAATVTAFLKKFTDRLQKKAQVDWKNPARVFLSVYMIVAHTSEIMPTMGEEEEALKKVATEFLYKFESWLLEYSPPIKHKSFSVESTTTLLSAWISYYTKFETWKERDTMKIVDGLISHYLELENLWLSVKDQIDADVQWKPRVEEQQKQIFGRLSKFGDHAMQRFMDARRELHQQYGLLEDEEDSDAAHLSQMSVDESSGDEASRAQSNGIAIPGTGRRNHAEVASRSVSPSPSLSIMSTSPQRFPGRLQQRKSFTDSVSRANAITPQPIGRRPSSALSSANNSRPNSPPNVEVVIPQKPAVVTPRAKDLPLSSPSEKKPFATPGFGDFLTNEKLAHELTLDPEFTLKKPELSELEKRVTESARRAFFDQVKAAFAKGDFESHVPEFIEDIKKQLMTMISEKGKIAAEIEEKLDLPFITHQIKNKSLDLPALLSYISSKMAQLCAPLRDISIRTINNTIANSHTATDLVPVFDSILQVLDDMKLDLANYRLQTLRPHLKTQAVEYEKSKFRQTLAALEASTTPAKPTTFYLARTKAWLAVTVEAKSATAAQRNPENIDLPENRLRYTDILHDALLGIVFGNHAVNPATIPETLVMDGHRLFAFQNEGQMVVIVAALLMLVQNIVTEGRGDKSFLALLKDRLMSLLKSSDQEGLSLDNLSLEMISMCNTQVMEKKRARLVSFGKAGGSDAVVEGLDETRQGLIRTMVEKTLSTKDAVFGLLRRRVQAAVKAHVVTGTFKREGLEKAGLDVIRAELEAFSYRVAVWARYNGEVYGEWYDEVLKELLDE
ncbi:hypothetical protein HDU78_005487 [Chytriomyces hyalinus]|nr:hypothetical protein HDU78_005487 [Chytriomyces hyalinus]